MPTVPDDLAAEFDMHMRRAGLTVPPEHRPGLLVSFAELREQVDLLRTGRTAAAEPSNIYRMRRIAAP